MTMESFAVILETGDYYLGVVSYDGMETNYDLGISLAQDLTGANSEISSMSFSTEEISMF